MTSLRRTTRLGVLSESRSRAIIFINSREDISSVGKTERENMSVKVGLLSALMLPLVAVSAIAETKTTSWRTDGVDDWDWTNDENFTNGAPVADDIVEIPNGFTVYATNAAARARLASLKQVSPQGKTATLVLAVPADETVTIAGPLARDYWCKYGVFVKRGAGLAVLDSESKLTSSSESSDYMLSDILVEGAFSRSSKMRRRRTSTIMLRFPRARSSERSSAASKRQFQV